MQAPPPKNGKGAWKISSHASLRSVRGFDNWIIAHAVWLEILPSLVSLCLLCWTVPKCLL